jgi:hypothetical protein
MYDMPPRIKPPYPSPIQVKGPNGAVLNLNYMMQYQLANYHEAEHPDGYHFSAKLNRSGQGSRSAPSPSLSPPHHHF